MNKAIKTMCAVAMLLTATVSATAQSVSYPRVHFGIRAGVTANTRIFSEGNQNVKVMPNAYGGLAFDFKIAPIPLYIETGAYVMEKGYRREYDHIGYYGIKTTENVHESDVFVHAPVLVSYHLYLNDKIAIQPFAGVTVGYLCESDIADAALRIGCGFNFGRLYANIGYDFGMVGGDDDFYVADYFGNYHFKENHWRNNTFFATIGFNFAGRR